MALADAAEEADAKLMAANAGLAAALEELEIWCQASDTMSVEDQIAANTATLNAALVIAQATWLPKMWRLRKQMLALTGASLKVDTTQPLLTQAGSFGKGG